LKLGKNVIRDRYTDIGVVFRGLRRRVPLLCRLSRPVDSAIHSLAKKVKDLSDSSIDALRAFHLGEIRDLLQRQVLFEP
jgi:hypothetical protein